jgi:hypothetical protein
MGGASSAASQAQFRLGVLDEEDGAFSSALEHYRSSISREAATPWARAARLRIAWIEQRSEGDFRPLMALQRVRLHPDGERSGTAGGAAIQELAREVDTYPPGRVRVEARLLLAHAWLPLPAHREEALSDLRKVVDDPRAGPRDARLSQRELVNALLADQRLDEATEELRVHPLDPKLAEDVRRLVRRETLRRAGYPAMATALVAALLFARRRLSRPRRPAVDGA